MLFNYQNSRNNSPRWANNTNISARRGGKCLFDSCYIWEIIPCTCPNHPQKHSQPCITYQIVNFLDVYVTYLPPLGPYIQVQFHHRLSYTCIHFVRYSGHIQWLNFKNGTEEEGR